MTYERFEDLPVWQEAARLAEGMFRLTEDDRFVRHPGFRDQIERAAISVSNNIAEGFERGTTNELLAFIYIARGSAGETRSMLCVAERIARFRDLKSQISNFKSSAESCSRQLRAWADSLQNSPIRGQRHLNDAARRMERQRAAAEDFQRKLVETLPIGHPMREFQERKMRGAASASPAKAERKKPCAPAR